MFKKNSIYKLIQSVKTFISSNEFKIKHCLKKKLSRETESYHSRTLSALY